MSNNSKQTQAWLSHFGVEYTDRNLMTTTEMNLMYKKQYGVSRFDMNKEFIGGLDRDIKILEVGANIGLQLMFLQQLGFQNLYGIELSSYAIELSKEKTKNINIIQVNALDIPFKDKCFDLVFTSGVLIHINPEELYIVMREIHRVTKTYIWGFEYYADKYTQIKYREGGGTTDLLWKADFPKIFCCEFEDLREMQVRKYKYLRGNNKDVMYLLRREADET